MMPVRLIDGAEAAENYCHACEATPGKLVYVGHDPVDGFEPMDHSCTEALICLACAKAAVAALEGEP